MQSDKQIKTAVYDDVETMFYEQDLILEDKDIVRDILINKQISVIEDLIKGDENLEFFWECAKEGMKRAEITANMDITVSQLGQLQEIITIKG